MLQLQRNVEINYPICTHIDAPQLQFRPRSIRPYRIRDLVKNPLTIREYLARPYTRRGRYLALSKDLTTGTLKQFYLSSTEEHWRDTPLRLCLFNDTTGKIDCLMPHLYGSTKRDRLVLSKVVIEFLDTEFEPGFRLGIFADDLQVIQ